MGSQWRTVLHQRRRRPRRVTRTAVQHRGRRRTGIRIPLRRLLCCRGLAISVRIPQAAPGRLMTSRAIYALAAAIIVAVLPFYYLAWSTPSFGIVHDDGIYVVTAKALATGQGYKIISLPSALPQTKYPILF